MNSTRQSLILAALFVLLSAKGLVAQTTGSIIGRVVDVATGQPLVGADIRLEKLPHRVTTGPDGRFVIGAVPPGERDIRVEQLGYKPVRVTRIPVRTGTAAEVRVEMETSPVEVEAVVVRA